MKGCGHFTSPVLKDGWTPKLCLEWYGNVRNTQHVYSGAECDPEIPIQLCDFKSLHSMKK